MSHEKWIKHMLNDEELQKLLEDKINSLIEQYFVGNSDYAIEKFVKSFSETLVYLESSLLLAKGIHPSQIQDNIMELSMNSEGTTQKINEVKQILRSEIERQYKHYQTFLGELAFGPMSRLK